MLRTSGIVRLVDVSLNKQAPGVNVGSNLVKETFVTHTSKYLFTGVWTACSSIEGSQLLNPNP